MLGEILIILVKMMRIILMEMVMMLLVVEKVMLMVCSVMVVTRPGPDQSQGQWLHSSQLSSHPSPVPLPDLPVNHQSLTQPPGLRQIYSFQFRSNKL